MKSCFTGRHLPAVGQRRLWLVTMSEVMTMALPLLDGREFHPFDCEPQSSHCHVSHCVKRSPRTVLSSPSWQQLLSS